MNRQLGYCYRMTSEGKRRMIKVSLPHFFQKPPADVRFWTLVPYSDVKDHD